MSVSDIAYWDYKIDFQIKKNDGSDLEIDNIIDVKTEIKNIYSKFLKTYFGQEMYNVEDYVVFEDNRTDNTVFNAKISTSGGLTILNGTLILKLPEYRNYGIHQLALQKSFSNEIKLKTLIVEFNGVSAIVSAYHYIQFYAPTYYRDNKLSGIISSGRIGLSTSEDLKKYINADDIKITSTSNVMSLTNDGLTLSGTTLNFTFNDAIRVKVKYTVNEEDEEFFVPNKFEIGLISGTITIKEINPNYNYYYGYQSENTNVRKLTLTTTNENVEIDDKKEKEVLVKNEDIYQYTVPNYRFGYEKGEEANYLSGLGFPYIAEEKKNYKFDNKINYGEEEGDADYFNYNGLQNAIYTYLTSNENTINPNFYQEITFDKDNRTVMIRTEEGSYTENNIDDILIISRNPTTSITSYNIKKDKTETWMYEKDFYDWIDKKNYNNSIYQLSFIAKWDVLWYQTKRDVIISGITGSISTTGTISYTIDYDLSLNSTKITLKNNGISNKTGKWYSKIKYSVEEFIKCFPNCITISNPTINLEITNETSEGRIVERILRWEDFNGDYITSIGDKIIYPYESGQAPNAWNGKISVDFTLSNFFFVNTDPTAVLAPRINYKEKSTEIYTFHQPRIKEVLLPTYFNITRELRIPKGVIESDFISILGTRRKTYNYKNYNNDDTVYFNASAYSENDYYSGNIPKWIHEDGKDSNTGVMIYDDLLYKYNSYAFKAEDYTLKNYFYSLSTSIGSTYDTSSKYNNTVLWNIGWKNPTADQKVYWIIGITYNGNQNIPKPSETGVTGNTDNTGVTGETGLTDPIGEN